MPTSWVTLNPKKKKKKSSGCLIIECYIYIWMIKCVKIRIMLLKIWKYVLELNYQTGPKYLVTEYLSFFFFFNLIHDTLVCKFKVLVKLLKKLSAFLTYFDVASLYIFLFGLNSLLIFFFFFTTNNLQQYKMSNYLTIFFFVYL